MRYRVRTVEIAGPEATSLAAGATYDDTIAETNNLHRRVLIICALAVGAAGCSAGCWPRSRSGRCGGWPPRPGRSRPVTGARRRDRRSHRGRGDRRGDQGSAGADLDRTGADPGGACLGARLRRGVGPRAAHPVDRDAHQPRGADHPGGDRRATQGSARRRRAHPEPASKPPWVHWNALPRANFRRSRSRSRRHHRAARPRRARRDTGVPRPRRSLVPSPTCIIIGLPAGLRLAVDNAIANAVKHGGATRVQLSAVSSREGVEIAIDDNGSGVPEAERSGSSNASPGGRRRHIPVRARPGAGGPAGRIARWHRLVGGQRARWCAAGAELPAPH